MFQLSNSPNLMTTTFNYHCVRERYFGLNRGFPEVSRKVGSISLEDIAVLNLSVGKHSHSAEERDF